jgi:uncharacterized phage protein (TIGR01671 family)
VKTKFRAWEKEARFYLNDFVIDNDGTVICFDNEGVAAIIDAELEQLIGLQDKSGADIYEGDIVEPMPQYSDWLTKGYVVFERGSFVIKTLNPFFTKSHDQLTAHSDKYKVVGNINENPDLLNAYDGEQ